MPLQSKVVPDEGVKPIETLMLEGAELKTALAGGKLRLFKAGTALDILTTTDNLVASEADYDGYTAGGVAVAAANDPYIDGIESVVVTLPLVQFNYTDGADHVHNTIGGAFYCDAAGKVRGAFEFDTSVNMASNSDSIPVVMAFRLGVAVS